MSKLFALKDWLPLSDAAKRLSVSFGEEVTEADVIQLALDKHLRLSIQIIHPVYALRLYRKLESEIQFEETEYTLPIEYDPKQIVMTKLEPTVLHISELCEKGEVLELGTSAICFSRDYPERDVVDLPMTHFSRSFLLECYDHFHYGPEEPVEWTTDKLLIQEKDGNLWQIESYENFLPGDITIVVRTQALRDLEQSFEPAPKGEQDKPLSSRERDTLLTLIAAMAKEGYKHDPRNRANSAVSEILADVQRAGLSISDQTIRDKLKDAWELLPGNPRIT